MMPFEDHARWHFLGKNATWPQPFCKEQNRNRCSDCLVNRRAWCDRIHGLSSEAVTRFKTRHARIALEFEGVLCAKTVENQLVKRFSVLFLPVFIWFCRVSDHVMPRIRFIFNRTMEKWGGGRGGGVCSRLHPHGFRSHELSVRQKCAIICKPPPAVGQTLARRLAVSGPIADSSDTAWRGLPGCGKRA